MIRDLDRLSDERFDLLIIGGGIVGAGIARDAALRGLKTALIDQGDVANGTSSRSSKLVHGGLRYLERAEIRLVRESCVEREILLRIAPHLVQPLPMMIPCYRGRGRPAWKVRAGLAVYDALAGGRVPADRRHRMLAPPEMRRLEPALSADRLEGGGMYFDCRMNDARLCLETLIDAVEHGAAAANYVRAADLMKSGGRIVGAAAEDVESGREIKITASVVVNATGPWADALRLIDQPVARPLVRKTRGVHLVTKRLTGSVGLALTARSDGRLFFVLPFEDRYSLIGTTDTDSAEDPGRPAVEDADVTYLLGETAEYLPTAGISQDDILGSFAGLRTLINTPGHPSKVSREDLIEISRSGLISVIGGKFTTYRAMSERVVDQVCGALDRPRGRCRTRECFFGATPAGRDRKAAAIAEILRDDPSLSQEIIPGSGVIRAEAVYAARHEMARQPLDFFRRRTTLALTHRLQDFQDRGLLSEWF
ncbi:glycerol-3-phosphate dehydrogenase/oxidase [bacterium]|nr:glycerol-3-phosphate dehydrogenase/oxidase [bacterium]